MGLWLDLVRVPPSGTWERRRADLYATAQSWVGPEDGGVEVAVRRLVRAYLRGFGPAPPSDIANWAGLPVRAIAPALEGLRRFRGDRGEVLLDDARAPLPPPETAAPLRFLPVWDAALLVHARRTGILPEEYRGRVFSTKMPQLVGTFLVDGAVAGTWRHADGRVRLEEFRRLDGATRRQLADEAERLANSTRDPVGLIHSCVVDLGNLGICECGFIAVERCDDCGGILCEEHANELPPVPNGLSGYATGQFSRAVRVVDGVRCVSCRAHLGRIAAYDAHSAPREPLPDHWLDRAMALIADDTRSAEEKRVDGAPPSTLTARDVAQEFLRCIGSRPIEQAPVTPSSLFRGPDYVAGWTVNCRRTEYTQGAPGSARYPLPLLISVDGELLGPTLEAGDRPSSTWFVVPESDIDLQRLVSGVANILVLSRFGSPSLGRPAAAQRSTRMRK